MTGEAIRVPRIDESEAEYVKVTRIEAEGSRSQTEIPVSREFPVTIILNDQELVTLLCTPKKLDCLAAGFLFSEGLLGARDEIERILVDEPRGVVRVRTKNVRTIDQNVLFKRLITSGCGRGAAFYSAVDTETRKVESKVTITAAEVFEMANRFQHSSPGYLATHGVHSSALCRGSEILVFNEDIGRHNAVDKSFGEAILKGISTVDLVLITSGRVSSEILHKVAKREIPILVSISVPTNLGVNIASSLGVTLIGSVRGKKMVVYTHEWRVT